MASDPPTLSYRSPREESDEVPTSPYVEATNRFFQGLTWAILAIVLLFWAVFGAIFWIPLLLRAMLRFSISLIEGMFEGRKPTESARILRNAVDFYRRGFIVAVEVVTREEVAEEHQEKGEPARENRLLLEVLWAILVWYFLFLWFGWIQSSPVDLWNWFWSVPWGDALLGFGDWVMGLFR